MQHDNEKRPRFRRFRIPRGGGFYLALSLAVVAMGLGVWGAVNNSLRNNQFQTPTTVPRSTINWEEFVTRPLPPETEAQPAAEPVHDEPDQRPETEAPTAVRTDNMPFSGQFALPFGTNVIKDFSDGQMVRSATMGDWRVHNGVDFAGERDQEVLAIQDGTVLSVSNDPLWGVIVTIDHGHGIVARYKGLQDGSVVREGREVSKGEAIGVIGQVPSESANGSVHLHFEISVDGRIEDPLAVMNRAN